MFVYIIHLRLYECSPRFILQLHAANEEQEKCHLLVFYILDLIFFLKCIRISAPVLQQIGLLVEAGLQWWRVQTQFSAICKNVLKGTVWIKSWKASPSLTSSLQVPWELAFALWNSERSLLKTGEAEKKTSRQPAKMDCYKKTVPNQMGALCSGWRWRWRKFLLLTRVDFFLAISRTFHSSGHCTHYPAPWRPIQIQTHLWCSPNGTGTELVLSLPWVQKNLSRTFRRNSVLQIHRWSTVYIYVLSVGKTWRVLNWHGSCAENAKSIPLILQCSRKCGLCNMVWGTQNSAVKYHDSSVILV